MKKSLTQLIEEGYVIFLVIADEKKQEFLKDAIEAKLCWSNDLAVSEDDCSRITSLMVVDDKRVGITNTHVMKGLDKYPFDEEFIIPVIDGSSLRNTTRKAIKIHY